MLAGSSRQNCVESSDGEIGVKSGLSSFTNSSANSLVHMSKYAPPNSVGGPLETESNLNYADDHQESPIDLINETAKMKHLSSEDFKTFEERQLMQQAPLRPGSMVAAASSLAGSRLDDDTTSLRQDRGHSFQYGSN